VCCHSDRLETEAWGSKLVDDLDRDAYAVVEGNWQRHFAPELIADLHRFRKYR
jgi:hypothetical protein